MSILPRQDFLQRESQAMRVSTQISESIQRCAVSGRSLRGKIDGLKDKDFYGIEIEP